MKSRAYPLLAASSLACLALAAAGTRPRYGGSLRVEIAARPSTLELADGRGVADTVAALRLRELIYDRLVRLDAEGRPAPALAVAWDHDETAAKWRFKLRTGIKWHDGMPLAPSEVESSLKGLGAASVRVTEENTLEIDAGRSSPGLLMRLATAPDLTICPSDPAHPHPAATGHVQNGLVGTGPFRLTDWEPGQRAVLEANEDYWDGRPYLDSIEVQMGRASRDALLDLELGKADVVELDPAEARRAQQEDKKVWISAPVELLCLRFRAGDPSVQDRRVRQALADSIDRAAIQKVLLQSYGNAAGSIFPQWLSGYAFLLPAAMNLDRARGMVAALGPAPQLKLGYGEGDTLARETAERVAVNVRDAGITLAAAPYASGAGPQAAAGFDVTVQRVRIDGPALGVAVRQAEASLGFPAGEESGQPEPTYAAERQFIESLTAIPLVHVPDLVGLSPRVLNWSATAWDAWRLERASLGGEKP